MSSENSEKSTSSDQPDGENPELQKKGKKATKDAEDEKDIPSKHDKNPEEKLKQSLEETFPASDPPGFTPERS